MNTIKKNLLLVLYMTGVLANGQIEEPLNIL